jgi:hypothetical protein
MGGYILHVFRSRLKNTRAILRPERSGLRSHESASSDKGSYESPSRRQTTMSLLPKANQLPSNDQSNGSCGKFIGYSSAPGSSDFFMSVVNWGEDPRSELKRICLPSGDQTPYQSFAGSVVKGETIPRANSASQRSRFPSCASGRLKARRSPAGESLGWLSSPRSEAFLEADLAGQTTAGAYT